ATVATTASAVVTRPTVFSVSGHTLRISGGKYDPTKPGSPGVVLISYPGDTPTEITFIDLAGGVAGGPVLAGPGCAAYEKDVSASDMPAVTSIQVRFADNPFNVLYLTAGPFPLVTDLKITGGTGDDHITIPPVFPSLSKNISLKLGGQPGDTIDLN